ncbi:MAG: TIGR03915 family putative DNA repair protein [Fretibacterium sp.]|nr:TIGR03915 family putative DNA repair protein [Fretibacterium sp.]
MIYVYDGTWSGMMTLVHRTALEGLAPEDIVRFSCRKTGRILLECTEVASDAEAAEATSAVLEQRLEGRGLADASLALMSEEEGIDLAVWCYLHRLWREGDAASCDLASPCVGAVHRSARRTSREWHRWMGLVRFRDVGKAYYAAFAPDCDILPLLAEHFLRRLPDRWVLHDVRRGRAAVQERGRWVLTDMELPEGMLRFAPEEEGCRELWREFFRSAAVKERRSLKRQMRFLPKRTWKYLIERPGEEAGS